jgi:hypothetical protein
MTEYAPRIQFISNDLGSEAVGFSGGAPHMVVRMQGLRNLDVTTLITALPPVADTKKGFMGYEVHGNEKGATMSARFTSTDAARGFVNQAIKALDMQEKGAEIRQQFTETAEHFHAANGLAAA